MPKFIPWSDKIVAQLAGLPVGTPVVEVDQQFHLDVLPQDIKRAIPHDPCQCAIAVAAARQSGLPKQLHPVITSGSIYIPMRKGQGWFLARYQHTGEAHKRLLEFDETGKFPVGGVTFLPVKPAKRREYLRAGYTKRNEVRVDNRANHASQGTARSTARTLRPLSGVVLQA